MAIKKYYGDDYYTYCQLKNRSKKNFNIAEKKRIELSFPSPEILEQYEQMEEGFIRKLLRMSEIEQQHRHRQEQKLLEAKVKHARLGKISSIVLTFLLVLLSYELIGHQHYKFAGFFITLAFILIIGSVVTTYSSKQHK